MDIPSLNHLVGAIRQHAPIQKLIVFGSASLLGTYPDLAIADTMVRRSRDADFLMFPWDEDVGFAIPNDIGADFAFDHQHGYHADIVRPFATENFPPGWEERLVPLPDMTNAYCLNPLFLSRGGGFGVEEDFGGDVEIHFEAGSGEGGLHSGPTSQENHFPQ